MFCLVYALTNYSGFCVIPTSGLVLPCCNMFSPNNIIFVDSLLPMKGFSQSIPLIVHYRITEELLSCHVTGRYYSMLYTLVKGLFYRFFFFCNFLELRFPTPMLRSVLTFIRHNIMNPNPFNFRDHRLPVGVYDPSIMTSP